MGNPNAGKSAIFSRLTGSHVVVSNYSGTTVEFIRGKMKLADETAELTDVPGAYTLGPANRAEQVAADMLKDGDVIINVIDATNMESSLYLTLQLLQTGKPVLIVLNMWDEVLKQNIKIDIGKLESIFGVPVVSTSALSGEGIILLKKRLTEARPGSLPLEIRNDNLKAIGHIVRNTQQVPQNAPSFWQQLDYMTVHPVSGTLIALTTLFLSFAFVGWFGDWLQDDVIEELFKFFWLPVAESISAGLGSAGWIHDILIGERIEGRIDFIESFGLLTTGLFIPIAVVLPYVFCFFLVLSLLEDIGYLPRIGVVIDTLMQRLGLQGLSIVPIMLGIGCNVPGVMAGRVLETKKQRFIVATLIAIVVPCMAQQAMVIGLLGQAGITGLSIVYGTLFILWIVLGILMNLFLKGKTPEMLMDLPPFRLPYWESSLKKIYMRMNSFIKNALPFVLLGVFMVNLLYTMGIIDFISDAFSPVITTLFGLPGESGAALIVGFLRKDVAVGMLASLDMNLHQLIVASVVLMVYFPCVATFVVLFKELGIWDLLKLIMIMIVVVIIVGGGLNLLLGLTDQI
ncbi:MAG: ferrous iron transporter B [Balneolales bacterium]